MTKTKRIILEDGSPPQFDGAWTVGELLQMAQQLAAWVERLPVTSSHPPPKPPELPKK